MKSNPTAMRDRKFILSALIAVLMLAAGLLLAGCSAGSTSSFEHKTARDIFEIEDYLERAQQRYTDEETAYIADEQERTDLLYELADDFNKANTQYRNGNYSAAQKGYEQVIAQYSSHYGANNNLTLALLQQEKNDEALEQALLAYIRSDAEEELLINIQVAMVACGFAASDLDTCSIVSSPRDSFAVMTTASVGLSGDQEKAYEYNKLWDAVEVKLDKSTSDNETDMQKEYSDIISQIKKKKSSGDYDWQELTDYTNACAYTLGIIDKDAYEAAQKSS